MFFDGKVGAKKNVSLARGNAVKSKEELMRESQKLREQREIERKRNQQVSKIQRNVRTVMVGCKDGLRAFMRLEKEFASNAATLAGKMTILEALHLFTFHYQHFLRHEAYSRKLGVVAEANRCHHIRQEMLKSLQSLILDKKALIWDGFGQHLSTSMSPMSDVRLVRLSKLLNITIQQVFDMATTGEIVQQNVTFLEQLFSPLLVEDSHSDDVTLGLFALALRQSEFFAQQLSSYSQNVVARSSVSFETQPYCCSVISRVLQHALLRPSHQRMRYKQHYAVLAATINLLSISNVFAETSSQSLLRALLQQASYDSWQQVFYRLGIITSSNQTIATTTTTTIVSASDKKKVDFMINFAIAFREGLVMQDGPMAALLVCGLNVVLCSIESNLLLVTKSLRDRELLSFLTLKESGSRSGLGSGSIPMDTDMNDEHGEDYLMKPSMTGMTDLITSEVYQDYRMADGYKKFDYRIAMLQYGLLLSYNSHAHAHSESSDNKDCASLIDLLFQGQSDILVTLFDLYFTSDFTAKGKSMGMGTSASPQDFNDLPTQAALISFVTQLLCISPIILLGNHHGRKVVQEPPLKSSELKSKILKSLAFTHSLHPQSTSSSSSATTTTNKGSFVQRLWQFLRQFFGQSLLTILVTVEEKVFLNHPDVTSLSNRSGMTNIQLYKLGLECMNLLSNVFNYSLNAIDDDELLIEQRVMKKEELIELFMFLKQFMIRFYWIEGLCTIGSQFLFPNPIECTFLNLLKHQTLAATTALFHQLSIRNDRRNFVDPLSIHWSIPFSNQDFQLVDSSSTFNSSASSASANPFVAARAEELEEENESFSLRNPMVKTILTFIPQVIPFNQRVQLLHALIEKDHHNYQDMTTTSFFQVPEHIEIRRDHLIEDAVEKLYPIGHKMKSRIQIQFISAQGFAEAGIDGGGLFKEFMDSFAKTICDPAYGLFIPTTSQQLVPNPGSKEAHVQNHLKLYEFVGRIIGKAMYEKLLFESELAPGFLNILLGRSNQLDDLIHLDNTLYRSLIDMKRRANVGEDISSYGLHFEMSHDIFGKHVTEEIKPNGSNIAVTNSNLREYILLLANYKQNVMIRSQCRAFIKGFREMIPLDWIRMFHVRELQLVIGGDQRKIDVQDMKRHTAYHGYAENERYIQSFWKIVEEMDIEDQCNLLRFVTSCPRQPLLGFGQLQPKLGIQKVNAYEYAAAYDGRNLNDRDRDKAAKLPTAATCMNLLKLPYYNSDELLKEKLLYAIRSKSGFELS